MINLEPNFKTIMENMFGPAAIAQNAADIEEIESKCQHDFELIEAQRDHQADTMGMNFFPTDGRCDSCRTNLVDLIPEHDLRNKNITGCPSCHYSFVG